MYHHSKYNVVAYTATGSTFLIRLTAASFTAIRQGFGATAGGIWAQNTMLTQHTIAIESDSHMAAEARKCKEPKIKWKDSKARHIMYKELTPDCNIPRDAKDSNGHFMVPLMKDIYNMHDEYKLYDPNKFSSCLNSLRTQYHECMMCNAMDIKAFDN
jgi:hypothetical protein